jgi:hypothetical protein
MLIPIVLATPVLAGAQREPSLDDPAVRTQVETLTAWAAEEAIRAAVIAHNGQELSLETIKELDARWVAGDAEAKLQELLTNACAERLKGLLAVDPAYREGLVMGDQGALVCLTGPSSDYWQGDEAKWQRSFDDGSGRVFVDRPRYDSSSRAILVQMSVPIVEAERVIGVLTVGIDRARFEH